MKHDGETGGQGYYKGTEEVFGGHKEAILYEK